MAGSRFDDDWRLTAAGRSARDLVHACGAGIGAGAGTGGFVAAVDLVLRATGKDLLFAPVGHTLKGVGGDERIERRLARPLRDDPVMLLVVDIAEHVRLGVAVDAAHRLDDFVKRLLERLFLARENVVVHSDRDHDADSFGG